MTEFLKYLDVLIGFSLVMLIACSLVTMVTQMAINGLKYRSQILKIGMEHLIEQLDSTLRNHAKTIAKEIMVHPLVAGWNSKGQKVDSTVIMREELVRVLLDLAGENSPLTREQKVGWTLRFRRWLSSLLQAKPDSEATKQDNEEEEQEQDGEAAKPESKSKFSLFWSWLSRLLVRLLGTPSQTAAANTAEQARLALNNVVTRGIPNSAEETLQTLENRMLELEGLYPAAATHFRQTRAIIDVTGDNPAIARIMNWFDEASNRMSDLFGRKAKSITVIISIVLAFSLPLDTLDILHRLATDDALRQATVQAAQKVADNGELEQVTVQAVQKVAEKKGKPEQAKTEADLKADIDTIDAMIKQLRGFGSSAVPVELWPMWDGEQELNASASIQGRIPGILLSIALLSLGASFWFEMLKNLLKLRPMLANKDDQDREERKNQITEPLPALPATNAAGFVSDMESRQRTANEDNLGANTLGSFEPANSVVILR